MNSSGTRTEKLAVLVPFSRRYAALAIVLAIALVFGRTVGHDFLLWDDNLHVTDNRLLDSPSWASLAHFWAHPYTGLYVPVSYTLFLAERALTARPDPHVFHAVNVALHAACAWFVFRLLRRGVSSDLAACIGALVFALHPLAVESVAWISETRGTLSALFGLVALDRWIAHMTFERERDASERTSIVSDAAPRVEGGALDRRWLRVSGIAVTFLLALLAKPSAVAFPLIALVFAVFVLRLPARRYAPWIVAGLAIAAVDVLVTKSLQSDETIHFVTALADRPRIALDALGFYLENVALPVDLGPDYGRRPSVVIAAELSAWTMIVPLAVLGVSLASAWLRATVLPGFALFVVALSPVLGLVPFVYQDISTVADRYAYLPLIGVALATALVVDRGLALERARARAALVVAIVVLSVFAVVSWRQAATWKDTETLFAHALEINPKSWVARTNRGLALLARGDREGALAEHQRALELRPDRPKSHNNVGILVLQMGQPGEAIAYFERALELSPNYANAHANLAIALFQLNRVAEAETHARAAIEAQPEIAGAHNTLANILVARNELEEALAEYEIAVELAPRDSDAQRNEALLLARVGQTALAIEHYEAALAARPAWADPAIELAWILVAGKPQGVRDPTRALELAQRVEPKTPEISVKRLDALAAAHAALGRFEEAVRLAREALTLAETRVPSAVATLRSRLAHYEAREIAW